MLAWNKRNSVFCELGYYWNPFFPDDMMCLFFTIIQVLMNQRKQITFQPVAFLPLILLWVLSIVLCLVMTPTLQLLCFAQLCWSRFYNSTTVNTPIQPPPVALMPSIPFSAVEWYFLFKGGRPSVDTDSPHHLILIFFLNYKKEVLHILKVLLLYEKIKA